MRKGGVRNVWKFLKLVTRGQQEDKEVKKRREIKFGRFETGVYYTLNEIKPRARV